MLYLKSIIKLRQRDISEQNAPITFTYASANVAINYARPLNFTSLGGTSGNLRACGG